MHTLEISTIFEINRGKKPNKNRTYGKVNQHGIKQKKKHKQTKYQVNVSFLVAIKHSKVLG